MYKKDIPTKNIPKKIGDTNIKPYWKVIEGVISKSNIILEVIDSRMPEISRNEEIERIVKEYEKELIIVANKKDLVTKKYLDGHLRKLKKENKVFSVSAKENMGTNRLRSHLLALSKNKESFIVGVLGYPNTGKSSIINCIAKKKKIKVSPRAGTTHGEHKIKAGKMTVLDTPGVIPLKENDEVRHTLIGSKNAEKVHNLEIVACEIIKIFENDGAIKKLYSVDNKGKEPEEVLEELGRKFNFIKKGNQIDESRTAIKLINDWQTGKLKHTKNL